jgi:hypothetical protein
MLNKGNANKPDWSYIVKNSFVDNNARESLTQTVRRIERGKDRYTSLEVKTGIPWYAFAIWHLRECDLDFRRCLHNGERIVGTSRKTKLVPSNRGPFSNWEESALDAVELMGYTKIKNWTLDIFLDKAERYNGLGYRRRIGDSGEVEYSPYMTAGTNWSDETGKFVSDGKYDPSAKESQLGVIALLIGLGIVEEKKPSFDHT